LSGEVFGDNEDTFPRLDTPKEWFPLFLFPGATQTVEMKKDTHYHAVKALLRRAGIGADSSQVTHIFRGSAARMADLQGASERDIARAGRWDMSAMTQYYLTTLSRETMRVLAGFSVERGSFWIARDLDPPKELEDMIFPQATSW
jgi:integrase